MKTNQEWAEEIIGALTNVSPGSLLERDTFRLYYTGKIKADALRHAAEICQDREDYCPSNASLITLRQAVRSILEEARKGRESNE